MRCRLPGLHPVTGQWGQDACNRCPSDIRRLVEMARDKRPRLHGGEWQRECQPARVPHGKAGASGERERFMAARECRTARPDTEMLAGFGENDAHADAAKASQPELSGACPVAGWQQRRGGDAENKQGVDGVGQQGEHRMQFGRGRGESCVESLGIRSVGIYSHVFPCLSNITKKQENLP